MVRQVDVLIKNAGRVEPDRPAIVNASSIRKGEMAMPGVFALIWALCIPLTILANLAWAGRRQRAPKACRVHWEPSSSSPVIGWKETDMVERYRWSKSG